jgi:hypothetical protein
LPASNAAIEKAANKKAKQVLFGGKLEKAYFLQYEDLNDRYRLKAKLAVQFNPSEYSINRRVKHSEKRALGRDTSSEDIQTACAEPSVLSLNLYFDSFTELQAEQGVVNYALSALSTPLNPLKGKFNEKIAANTILPSFDMNEDLSPAPDLLVNERLEKILAFVKYSSEAHAPPPVGFVWGNKLFFVGKILHHNVRYTVFDRDGTPVRAQLALSMVGEDRRFDNKEYPLESPDRTKQRTLRYGDQLWMTAQEEYGDVAHWKTIAAANGILNPRAIGNVVRLKVPSIR